MRRPGRHLDDRAIAALAFPALGALAADPLYSLVDTALVGNLGTAELGAVAIGTAAFTASFWLFSFLAYGVTPTVGRALGRGDERAAADIGVQALAVALIAGTIVAVTGLLLAGSIVGVLGGEGRIAQLGDDYLRIRICSAPFVLIALVGHGWLRGAQDTRTPMTIAIAGAVLNAVLDYLLIYPAGLGVAGAAWATLISQGLVAAWFVAALIKRFDAPRWRFDRRVVTDLLVVGGDLIVRTGSLLAALTVATSLAARMGAAQLGAWQIANQIFLLLSLTMDSLAIAAQALVARHLGADRLVEAKRVGNRLLELGTGLGVVLAAVLFAVSAPLADVFTDDSEVLALATDLLRYLALAQPIAALAFTLDGILIGALDTRFLAVAMVGASIAFVGVGILAFEMDWGVRGLAASAGVWLALRTATTGVRYGTRFAIAS